MTTKHRVFDVLYASFQCAVTPLRCAVTDITLGCAAHCEVLCASKCCAKCCGKNTDTTVGWPVPQHYSTSFSNNKYKRTHTRMRMHTHTHIGGVIERGLKCCRPPVGAVAMGALQVLS